MKSLIRVLGGTVLAVILVISGGFAASATPTAPIDARSSSAHPDASVLGSYVSATPSGYVLHAPSKVLRSVDPTQLAALRTYWESVREYVADGQLVFSGGRYVPRATGSISPASTWRGSHGYITTHWYGLEVGVDAYLRDKITGGMTIAAIAAGLGGGPYGIAVATVLGVSAALLLVCEHKNGWSYVYWVGLLPPFGTPVCNPFG